jgi:hypothetical protein
MGKKDSYNLMDGGIGSAPELNKLEMCDGDISTGLLSFNGDFVFEDFRKERKNL